MDQDYTIKEVSDILGITKDGVLKLAKKLSVGEKRVGMWWYTETEVQQLKLNCRKFIMSTR